jgi:hypothetical protein
MLKMEDPQSKTHFPKPSSPHPSMDFLRSTHDPKNFFFFFFLWLLLLLLLEINTRLSPTNSSKCSIWTIQRKTHFPKSPKEGEKGNKPTNEQTSFPFLPPLLSQRSHFNSFPFLKTQIFSPYKPRREKPILELNPLSSKQSWVQNCNKTHDSTHNIPLPHPSCPPLFLLPLSTCFLCDQSIAFSKGTHTCSDIYMLVNWYLLITFPWSNNVWEAKELDWMKYTSYVPMWPILSSYSQLAINLHFFSCFFPISSLRISLCVFRGQLIFCE